MNIRQLSRRRRALEYAATANFRRRITLIGFRRLMVAGIIIVAVSWWQYTYLHLGSYVRNNATFMALIVSTFSAFQRSAPGLSRKCLIRSRLYQKVLLPSRLSKNPVSRTPSRSFASNPVHASVGNTGGLAEGLRGFSPLSSLSKTISAPSIKTNDKSKVEDGFFPEVSDRIVAYWLLGSAASVFGIIVFGGLTRLTESGSASHSIGVCPS